MKNKYQLDLEKRIAILQSDLDIGYCKHTYREWSDCLALLKDYLAEKSNRRVDELKDEKRSRGES